MQNTSFFTLFLLLLIIFTLSCCKEDPPTPEPESPCTEEGLPCLTTEGKNMFACKVNGQPWIADTPYSIGGPVPIQGEYSEQEGWLYIKATRKNEFTYQSIKIYGKQIFSIINDSIRSPNPNPSGLVDLKSSSCNEYFHDTLRKGWLKIEYLDTDMNIISGRFSMNLFNTSCTDSIMYVTDGRFDLTY